jgi:hypothetical protein
VGKVLGRTPRRVAGHFIRSPADNTFLFSETEDGARGWPVCGAASRPNARGRFGLHTMPSRSATAAIPAAQAS